MNGSRGDARLAEAERRQEGTRTTTSRRSPGVVSVLAEAAWEIHGQRDLESVLAWTADAARSIGNADAAGIYAFHVHEHTPAWHTCGATPPVSTLGDLRPVEAFAPAVAGDAPVYLNHLDAGSLVSPWRSVIAVPVVDLDGDPQAVIVAASGRDEAFMGGAEEGLLALAAHLGAALDNQGAMARLSDLETSRREVVHQLQEAVRPPRPPAPNTELGVHYVASDPSAPTGGDLYDWVLLPDGDVHLAVVDIMGKGVGATKDALAVTHALRFLVLDGCPLGQLVERTDVVVTAQNPELVATLIVARYTPSSGRLELAGGGHPPALLVSDEGVREVAAPGIPIGWPGAASHGTVVVHLERSDTLILYTDGLVEVRKDIIAGLGDLRALAAETAGYPAAHLARVLVERSLEGVARHDDSLALVLRRRTPPPESGALLLAPFEYRFTPTAATVPLARHFLNDWLVRLPTAEGDTDDLLLVATELCANAVRHATGATRSVALRARADGADVVIEVEDDGAGLDWAERTDEELPDPESETGRGLFLVRALTDSIEVDTSGDITVVRATKRSVLPFGSVNS